MKDCKEIFKENVTPDGKTPADKEIFKENFTPGEKLQCRNLNDLPTNKNTLTINR